jgi:hypothetical protein
MTNASPLMARRRNRLTPRQEIRRSSGLHNSRRALRSRMRRRPSRPSSRSQPRHLRSQRHCAIRCVRAYCAGARSRVPDRGMSEGRPSRPGWRLREGPTLPTAVRDRGQHTGHLGSSHGTGDESARQRPARARGGAFPGRDRGAVETDPGPCPARSIAKLLPCFLEYLRADQARPISFLSYWYPWSSIFCLSYNLNPPPWRVGAGPCGANPTTPETRCG